MGGHNEYAPNSKHTKVTIAEDCALHSPNGFAVGGFVQNVSASTQPCHLLALILPATCMRNPKTKVIVGLSPHAHKQRNDQEDDLHLRGLDCKRTRLAVWAMREPHNDAGNCVQEMSAVDNFHKA